MFKSILVISLVLVALQTSEEILEQIRNTEELVYLYQEKLRLLKDLYEKDYPNITYEPKPKYINIKSTNKQSNNKLLLLNRYNHSNMLVQNRYLLGNGTIIDLHASQMIGEYLGSIIAQQPSVITTIVEGRVNMIEFKQIEGNIQIQQYFLGLQAEQFSSIWHRNLNIKDAQDLLIQWQGRKIIFRGKQIKQMILEQEEQILSIYSLNQYKVIFISTTRVGTINSRSLSIIDSLSVNNITKIKDIQQGTSKSIKIKKSFKNDNSILLLLSTGQVARYLNERIIFIQQLQPLSFIQKMPDHHYHIQTLMPYLFIVDIDAGILKVYSTASGRFMQICEIKLQLSSQTNQMTFYKQSQSYRMLISTKNQSSIYQILIPIAQEQASVGSGIFKFIGVIAVIVFFVYYKWVKKSDDTESVQSIPRRELKKKLSQAHQKPKEKNKQSSQVEQFMRRSGKERVDDEKAN